MSYDPAQDPRNILAVEGLEEEDSTERIQLEDELEKLQTSIAQYEQIQATFDTPGWGLFVGMLRNQKAQLEAALEKEHDQSQWKYLRGELREVEWVLQLDGERGEVDRRLKVQHSQRAQLLTKIEGA